MSIVKPDPYYLESREEGLHPTEFDFLLKTFFRGVDKPETPQYRKHMEIVYYGLTKTSVSKASSIIDNLVTKEMISKSPNGKMIRITDYGKESFEEFKKRQEEWETKDIIKISEGNDEITIKKGEKFKGLQSLREILSLAENEILIEDPYVSANIFEILYEISNDNLATRILTANKQDNKSLPAAITAYNNYKDEIGKIEMKFGQPEDMHERLIIIDLKVVYSLTSSTKDLGNKTATIKLLDDLKSKSSAFDEKWSRASEVK